MRETCSWREERDRPSLASLLPSSVTKAVRAGVSAEALAWLKAAAAVSLETTAIAWSSSVWGEEPSV